MKSYVFKVQLEQDEDGGWSAVIPALPGCAADGESAEEALVFVQDLAAAYVDILIEDGKPVPVDALDTTAVAIVAKAP